MVPLDNQVTHNEVNELQVIFGSRLTQLYPDSSQLNLLMQDLLRRKMWPARVMFYSYKTVTQADADFEHQSLAPGEATSMGVPKNRRSRYTKNWILASKTCLLLFPFILIITEVGTAIKSQLRSPQSATTAAKYSSTPRACINPAKRLEWRKLRDEQKIDYISAVMCLHSLPSQATSEGKLSDDFPWVHRHIGSFSTFHFSATGHFYEYFNAKHSLEPTMQHPFSPGIATSFPSTKISFVPNADTKGISRTYQNRLSANKYVSKHGNIPSMEKN